MPVTWSLAPGVAVLASTVGVFYCAPQPGAPPFVEEGDLVARGDQVGILEVMKLMIPVEADCAGRVTRLPSTGWNTAGPRMRSP